MDILYRTGRNIEDLDVINRKDQTGGLLVSKPSIDIMIHIMQRRNGLEDRGPIVLAPLRLPIGLFSLMAHERENLTNRRDGTAD